jgi:hypothetical protein
MYSRATYPLNQYPRFTATRKKLEYWRNIRFISFETRPKRERLQHSGIEQHKCTQHMSHLLSSPYLHFPEELVSIPSSSFLAVGVSYRVRLKFVSRKHLFAIIMVPKRKSIYAGMRRLPGCMARTSLPFVKWWRSKKKILQFLCCTANCKSYI